MVLVHLSKGLGTRFIQSPTVVQSSYFSTSQKPLNGILGKLTSLMYSTFPTSFVLSDQSSNKMFALFLGGWYIFLYESWQNLTGLEQVLKEVLYQVVECFWSIPKQGWLPWPLVDWDIFDFSSATTERIWQTMTASKFLTSFTELVFFFWGGGGGSSISKDRPGLWLTETFSTSLCNRWMEFDESWPEESTRLP